jgi:hypothetical protein
MRGHEALIATRMAGYRPQVPVVLHCPVSAWTFQDAPGYVQIALADRVDRLDLRFLVGLPVAVLGDHLGHVLEVCEAADAAGACGVIGLCGEKPRYRVDELVFASGDTDWITNWPKEESWQG